MKTLFLFLRNFFPHLFGLDSIFCCSFSLFPRTSPPTFSQATFFVDNCFHFLPRPNFCPDKLPTWQFCAELRTVCQMGQCSDISATTVFEVKTSLSGFNRLWGDTRVMWTHFFTFLITSCVSEMAQKWSILGQNDSLGH